MISMALNFLPCSDFSRRMPTVAGDIGYRWTGGDLISHIPQLDTDASPWSYLEQ